MNKASRYLYLLIFLFILLAAYTFFARIDKRQEESQPVVLPEITKNREAMTDYSADFSAANNTVSAEKDIIESKNEKSLSAGTSSMASDGLGTNNPKISLAPETAAKKPTTSFAQCIKESGAKFYGASWCSHCQSQKELFGEDAKYLPYIECANPDGNGQQAVCKENNIGGYPTWVFQDDSRLPGKLTFEQLSAKTGCPL